MRIPISAVITVKNHQIVSEKYEYVEFELNEYRAKKLCELSLFNLAEEERLQIKKAMDAYAASEAEKAV